MYLIPLFIMLITSFKTPMDIRTGNLMALPSEWTTLDWSKAWSEACTGVQCDGIRGYFWNSFKMTVPAVLISTLLEGYRWTGFAAPGALLAVAGMVIALRAKKA